MVRETPRRVYEAAMVRKTPRARSEAAILRIHANELARPLGEAVRGW